MILSFKEQFNKPIKKHIKIHTIRSDPNERWHKERKIHFANHIRSPKYNQFYAGWCTGVQPIFIDPSEKNINIDGKNIGPEIVAKNDGFETVEEFWNWFDEPFAGFVIHWTDFNY